MSASDMEARNIRRDAIFPINLVSSFATPSAIILLSLVYTTPLPSDTLLPKELLFDL